MPLLLHLPWCLQGFRFVLYAELSFFEIKCDVIYHMEVLQTHAGTVHLQAENRFHPKVLSIVPGLSSEICPILPLLKSSITSLAALA